MTTLTFEGVGPGPTYADIDIWLPLFQHEHFLAGGSMIEDRTFIDCRLHGPALMLPVSGCEFDACNLGNAYGDITNLMYRPMGPTKLVGAVAFRNCIFQRCTFVAVAFTGAEDFLKSFSAIRTTAS